MVEYYHSHTEVRIVKRDDLKAIYDICQDYTFEAAWRIKNGAFANEFPLEDLIKIDEFAEAVYQYAGHEYGRDKDFIRTFIGEGVGQVALKFQNLFDAVDKKVKDRKKKRIDEYTVYTTLSGQDVRDARPLESRGEKIELPPRASARDIFEDLVQRSGAGSRY
jgi:hypothetical protein